jgi:hypothetical protein
MVKRKSSDVNELFAQYLVVSDRAGKVDPVMIVERPHGLGDISLLSTFHERMPKRLQMAERPLE